MASLALSISQQQQLVYASLMRFGSETISLRFRCLDHLVMNGLLGASLENPLKIGELQRKLHSGTYSPIFRDEALRDTLSRLEKENKVSSIVIKKKKAYFLTQTGKEQMRDAIVSAESLYRPVVARLLKQTEHLIPADIGIGVCTTFLCEAFTRCGLGIAKNLQGTVVEFPHSGDLSAAFDAAVNGLSIPDEARRILENRCLALFKSRELEDKRLIFYLTQGYYFAQLLGLDHQSFDPISEQAFEGAIFYLDTNVLLPGLLPGNEVKAFVEVINVAKRIGITLRVTRATINEARRVAADRLNELTKIQDKVPAELAEKSLDDFVTHFYEQKAAKPELTPEEYLEPFEKLTDTVLGWGVEIDDIVEEEMLQGQPHPVLETRIQERSAQYRKGRVKSENVLRHDVAHYALVMAKRKSNAKTWFLTRDRSLMSSAEDVCGTGMPFCFGMIGFLQSISPYVVSDGEGTSLSVVFSSLLREQLITTDRLFDSRELVLLAEMHSDVLATAAENLLPAVDYVKFAVLKGKAYRAEDFPVVSLELRKFIASSTDEQKKALETLNAQLQVAANEEREAAKASREAQAGAEFALLEREDEIDKQAEQLQSSTRENAELREQLDAQRNRNRLVLALSGIVAGILIWVFRLDLASAIAAKIGARAMVDVGLGVASDALFCFPALNFLRYANWRTEIKLGIGGVVVFAAIWTTKVISASTAADVASYLAIATIVATFLVFPKWKS